jgi:hypothetical protein
MIIVKIGYNSNTIEIDISPIGVEQLIKPIDAMDIMSMAFLSRNHLTIMRDNKEKKNDN